MLKTKMKKKHKILKFPCVIAEQKGYKLYGFSILAKELWKIVQVNQRETDKDKGYQRILSPSRVDAIANYIRKGNNTIPNSIIVSFDYETKISYDKKNILIPDKVNAGWVIDGQHRLAGAKESDTDIELLVNAFIGLDVKQQINQFVTINKEAKNVPTSLYYDLLKHLPKKNESEFSKERASDIAKVLKGDENSPFFSRIILSSPQRGQLSLTNFVRKVSPLVLKNRGKFNRYTMEEQIGIFKNYFIALENVFPNEFKEERLTFFKTLGFGAIINFIDTVFDYSLRIYQGFTVENVVNVLKMIDYFDFSEWDKLGTGNSAELQAGDDLRSELTRQFDKNDIVGTINLK